jgi:hydroxymethylbilane synthase
MKLKLGTRGSELARTQALTVAAHLGAAGHDVELEIIRTAGDRSSATSFGSIGPQGVFVREIEQALSAGRVDLAVHSYKDLPTASPPELTIAAVPERRDPADLLLVRRGTAAASAGDAGLPLPTGARVGTASARRRVWLTHYRQDLRIAPLRGNVPTRIRRLRDGDYDAIVLAAAGIERLRDAGDVLEPLLDAIEIVRLDPTRFVSAPAQGALAIQCRVADTDVVTALAALDHSTSRAAVAAERDALARAEGGCDVAFGAFCRPLADGGFELTAMLERDGSIRTACVAGPDPAALGAEAWAALEAPR